MEKNIFHEVLEKNKPKRPIFLNAVKAFFVGGLICLVGQGLLVLFSKVFHLDEDTSKTMMYLVVIVSAVLLTGFGLFDKIGQFSGAGTLIPITGFANSVASSAIESKSEGLVLGILTNVFRLAGAVIATGVVSAILSGLILFFFRG
jgi:stage V sporulation protein AC